MLFVNCSIVAGLSCAMKLYHSSSRPSWISPEIKSYKCFYEYANPSGHTISCTYLTIYMFFIYVYYTNNTLVYKVFGRIFPRKLIQFGSFIVLTACTFIMGYSRVLLGAHTLNQVLYGFVLGLWSAIWVIFIVRRTLYLHLEDIAKRRLPISEIKYFLLFVWGLNAIVFGAQAYFLTNITS